jgi:predicted acyl esterase
MAEPTAPATEEPRLPETEIADGMRIDWDVPVVMDDGVVIRLDVYRPIEDGQYPAIMSMGPYGKNLPFQDPPYTGLWNEMVDKYPEIAAGSTNKYQSWEVADPEKWVPQGYAVIRVDSRGAAKSEGRIDCFSPRETQDYAALIDWAGTQGWSNGKVGLSGISYYGITQWLVAGLQPKHLAAMCIWEGASDWYREGAYHGGIHCGFVEHWYPVQAEAVQHGIGSRGPRNSHNGTLAAGPVELSDEELAANRGNLGQELREHSFDGQYYRDRSANFDKVKVPLLSAANWGGHGLHNRGNFTGYLRAASEQKWLEVHGREHWTVYYTDESLDLQRRFFDYFLKDEGDFAAAQPPVTLRVRHPGEKFVTRYEHEWPLARTTWSKAYLDPSAETLSFDPPAAELSGTYKGFGKGLELRLPVAEEETEITGPVAAKLFISSDTSDADLFLVLRLWDPDGNEVHFSGANEPKVPIAQGWLRASHRKLDPELSQPWQPWHPHLEEEPLTPGEVYEVDVEIWTTSIVIPPGYQLSLSVQGVDYDHGLGGVMSHIGVDMRGSGLWPHDAPEKRPAEIYDGNVTIYGGGDRASYVLLPVIPQD